MSVAESTRVWESSHRGALKLLLLAIADMANNDGVCYPGIKTLARAINETERHTIRLLAQLEASGDIAVKPGGGRGNVTVYALLTGVTPTEHAGRISVLHNTVVQRGVLRNSDMSGQKQCPTGSETVTCRAKPDKPFLAPQRAETAQNGVESHHDPDHDPSTTTMGAASPGGGGGGPTPFHPESAAILRAAGARATRKIAAAARLAPDQVRSVLASVPPGMRSPIGWALDECAARADAPALAVGAPAPARPPPSDAAIWALPAGSAQQRYLAAYRRAANDDERHAVLDRVREEAYARGA